MIVLASLLLKVSWPYLADVDPADDYFPLFFFISFVAFPLSEKYHHHHESRGRHDATKPGKHTTTPSLQLTETRNLRTVLGDAL